MTDKTQEELEEALTVLLIDFLVAHDVTVAKVQRLDDLIKTMFVYINKYYVPKGDLEDQVVSTEVGGNQVDTLMPDSAYLAQSLDDAKAAINAYTTNKIIEARIREISILADKYAAKSWGPYDPQQVLQDRLTELKALNHRKENK